MDIPRRPNLGILITPQGDDLVMSLPLFGTSMVTSPFFLGVLNMFDSEEGMSAEAVLSELMIRKKDSRAFIEQCIEKGFLLDVEEDGTTVPMCREVAPTFARVPKITDASAPFVFLGIPWDRSTSGYPGARFGPTSIRMASLSMQYTVDPHTRSSMGFYDFGQERTLLAGINLADGGDVLCNPGEKEKMIFDRVTYSTADILSRGAIPLIMGGDHSMTYATVSAFKGELAILHIDAHTDLGGLSLDGNVHHGSFLTGLLEQESPKIKSVVQVGLRGLYDIRASEKDPRVEQVGIKRARRMDVDAIVDLLPADLPLYISVDIDALDPAYAPSTGTPVASGMTPDKLIDLVCCAAKKRSVVGVDVMEVAAPNGHADMTSMIAVEVLVNAADAIVEGLRARLNAE